MNTNPIPNALPNTNIISIVIQSNSKPNTNTNTHTNQYPILPIINNKISNEKVIKKEISKTKGIPKE